SLTSWRVACSCARRAASISNRLLEAARSTKPCGVEGSGAAVAVSSAASVSSVWLSTASPPQAVRASAAAERSANRRVIGHVLSLGSPHATGQQAASSSDLISNRLLEAARSTKPCGVEGSGAAVAVSSAASVSSVWLSTASPPQAVRASAAAERSANRRVIGHVLSLGSPHATGQQAASS